MQVSFKISKISNFSFSFKLNEKKKVPLKRYGLERRGRGFEKVFAGGGLIFNRGLEIIQKNVAWQKKGGEKTEGDFVTLNESMKYVHWFNITCIIFYIVFLANTAQKMKFSIKDFLSKCDQIHSFPADLVAFT